jgi:hypothetical protein
MELKIKYQYTNFIYPYVIEESKYSKYLLRFLKDKKYNLKIFQKDKNYDLYKFFSPRVRESMFCSFDFNKAKLHTLNELDVETRAALLAKNECTMFEYNVNEDIQGKTGYKNGIFFKIQKIEIICFNTGICFLCIKTNIEDSEEFSDLLNFNYKFRDINQEFNNLDGYDNIRIQTNSFADIKKFREFIKDITGVNKKTRKLDIDTDRFLTYSYACIDQQAWNNEAGFENVTSAFNKYINIQPHDSSINLESNAVKVIQKSKYAKIGISKQGMNILASTADINNYTVLPQEYEEQYLYMYILALYKKIYLKKLSLEFKENPTINKNRKRFIQFTKNLWIQEVTSDDTGALVYNNLKDVLELDSIYYDTRNKYDILYKEFNIEKDRKTNKFIAVIICITLIFNIFNFIMLAMK